MFLAWYGGLKLGPLCWGTYVNSPAMLHMGPTLATMKANME